ncbi:MAG: hypothetical protein QG622_3011 [Actinomycetota bacterium]|nr:hypothetical protein [Actinomycetota bacterium]
MSDSTRLFRVSRRWHGRGGLSFLVVAAAATALTGCSGGPSEASVPDDSVTPAPPSVSSSVSVSSSASSSPSASESGSASAVAEPVRTSSGGGFFQMALGLTSPDGARKVTLSAEFLGKVPQELYVDGSKPVPAADTQLQGEHLDWGDGAKDNHDAEVYVCPERVTTFVDMKQTMTYQHTYTKPGTYVIKLETGPCAPVGRVAKTLTVTVR